jgi:metal-responsive CopG/Arc/MetJ family transcriptional regulator
MQKIPGIKCVNVVLLQAQVNKLDEIAKRFKISRSEALRRIVETGLDSYSVYEGLGVVKLAEITGRMKSAVEKDVQPSLFGRVALK